MSSVSQQMELRRAGAQRAQPSTTHPHHFPTTGTAQALMELPHQRQAAGARQAVLRIVGGPQLRAPRVRRSAGAPAAGPCWRGAGPPLTHRSRPWSASRPQALHGPLPFSAGLGGHEHRCAKDLLRSACSPAVPQAPGRVAGVRGSTPAAVPAEVSMCQHRSSARPVQHGSASHATAARRVGAGGDGAVSSFLPRVLHRRRARQAPVGPLGVGAGQGAAGAGAGVPVGLPLGAL